MLYTGEDLQIARILYGFKTQEELAKRLKVSVATIQRYESMDEVDAKILGQYTHELKFDLEEISLFVFKIRESRKAHGGKVSV